MEIGPLRNRIDGYLNVDVNHIDLMRDKDNYYTVKLKRYKEKATEDRSITGANLYVNWKITVYKSEYSNNLTTVELFPEIVSVKGTITYIDYVNPYGAEEEAEEILGGDLNVETDDDKEIEYEYKIDTEEDESWTIETSKWSNLKMGDNIEPTDLEIDLKDKKIIVIFDENNNDTF